MNSINFQNIFLYSLSAAGTVFIFQLLFHKIQTLFYKNIQLKPNCLLTRHPVLFISYSNNFFDFASPLYRHILYLREHGYEVSHLKLSKHIHSLQESQIAFFFKNRSLKNKFHIIGYHLNEKSILSLTDSASSHIQSMNSYDDIVKQSQQNNSSKEKSLLEFAQNIAEQEWT
ncbi:MAG: hypothetical protein HOO06_12375 [Bdellovibrionaceae bacterium]|jgi:hypothetical protein|nr:hypothetical protein [Pseudobdellovibrionaceae bacterium]